jgi:hypothetical protein
MKKKQQRKDGRAERRVQALGKDQLTKTERESLLRVARMRERVAKSGLIEVGAQLLVDLDKQLEASYGFNSDEIWKESYAIAHQATEEANVKVKQRCREFGIPDRFAPRIATAWLNQGEQAVKERQSELRQIARRQIDAMIKSGKRKIEEISCDVQTRIIASGLSSEAQTFLDTIPTPEQLMPRLNLGELEKMLGKGTGYYQRRLTDDDSTDIN